MSIVLNVLKKITALNVISKLILTMKIAFKSALSIKLLIPIENANPAEKAVKYA
jgi:hypothetical protein